MDCRMFANQQFTHSIEFESENHFIDFIANSQKLNFEFQSNEIGEAGAKWIGECLQINNSLTELNLRVRIILFHLFLIHKNSILILSGMKLEKQEQNGLQNVCKSTIHSLN